VLSGVKIDNSALAADTPPKPAGELTALPRPLAGLRKRGMEVKKMGGEERSGG